MQPILVLYKAPFRSNFQKQWSMEGAGPLRIPITWYFEVTVSEWDSAKKILLWLTLTIISNQNLGFKRIFSSLSNLVSNSSVLVKSPFLQNLCMLIGAHLGCMHVSLPWLLGVRRNILCPAWRGGCWSALWNALRTSLRRMFLSFSLQLFNKGLLKYGFSYDFW